VLPTALGQKRMMQIRQEVDEQDADMLKMLGQKDTDHFIELLQSLVEHRA
jgi:hypothetical protein